THAVYSGSIDTTWLSPAFTNKVVKIQPIHLSIRHRSLHYIFCRTRLPLYSSPISDISFYYILSFCHIQLIRQISFFLFPFHASLRLLLNLLDTDDVHSRLNSGHSVRQSRLLFHLPQLLMRPKPVYFRIHILPSLLM